MGLQIVSYVNGRSLSRAPAVQVYIVTMSRAFIILSGGVV
jgi:hypothetical protein